MGLMLRVRRYRGRPVQRSVQCMFEHHGGGIGRAEDNHWVLPDPDCFVSSRHATIDCIDGLYFIVDTSSNGTYLNGVSLPRGENATVRLRNADRLRIGEYEIEVILSKDTRPGAAQLDGLSTPIGADDGHLAHNESAVLASHVGTLGPEPPPDHPLDQIRLHALDQQLSVPGANERGAEPNHVAADRAFFRPPDVDIPENWDYTTPPDAQAVGLPGTSLGEHAAAQAFALQTTPDLHPTDGAKQLVAPQLEPALHATEGEVPSGAMEHALLNEFFAAAGVEPPPLTTTTARAAMRRAGALFGEAVRGTQALLRCRSELKEEVRAPRTLAWKSDNPLKNLAISHDELIELLLAGDDRLAAEPGAHMVNAMADLKAHELATLAGMGAALRAALQRLDPAQFNRPRSGLLMPRGKTARKARRWDAFVEEYARVIAEEDDVLRGVLQKEFAQAYERELRALARDRDNVR